MELTKTEGDNSGRASLSVLVVPVPVPVPVPARAPRADPAQSMLTAPQGNKVAPPRNLTVPTYNEPPVYNTSYNTPSYNPLPAPHPSATPSTAPSAEPPAPTAPYVPLVPVFNQRPTSNAVPSYNPLPPYVPPVPVFNQRLTSNAVPSYNPTAPSAEPPAPTPPYVPPVPVFNQRPTRNAVPSYNPLPAPQPSATPSTAPSAEPPAPTAPYVPLVPVFNQRPTSNAVPSYNPLPPYVPPVPVFNQRLTSNAVPSYNPTAPSAERPASTPPYVPPVPVFNQRPTSNAVPSYNPLPAPQPSATPSTAPSAEPPAPTPPYVPLVPVFNQRPTSNAVPSYNPLPAPQPSATPSTAPSAEHPAPTAPYVAPVPVFNQRLTSNAVPSYNPLPAPQPSATPSTAPSAEPPAPTAPYVPPVPVDVQNESPRAPSPQCTPPQRPITDERLAINTPKFPPVEDSRLLVEQFQAQVPDDPTLPPIGIDPFSRVSTDDYTVDELKELQGESAVGEVQTPERSRKIDCKQRRSEAGRRGGAFEPKWEGWTRPPPPPRFERSLVLRARLTVPHADFTEKYSMWWDVSGASRVDFHGGATSTYHMIKPDGRVQSVQIRVDRTAEEDVWRCVVSAPRHAALAERALPALPDLQSFSFAGYVVHGVGRAELWRYTLSGHSGELGGARGEALTFRHELLVTRSADNLTTTPQWYSVRVDSSVLGADSDGYVHQFDEVQARNHDPSMFHLDIDNACEQVEMTNRTESVEPLREFTMLHRDPRYDTELEQYKQKFGRTYADDMEEAVRKNILIQSSRHRTSGNRQGGAFKQETNFMSDRLVVERTVFQGVEPAAAGADYGAPFPYTRAELEALCARLPRKFDWRENGAVTPVRNQWQCSSCWAFATVGAVEGALFIKTGHLVPLSEQALVDCAQPYGGNGCNATWPSFAYNYIKDQGLPALDEYTPYKGKELQCRADSVPAVTRISGHLNVTKDSSLALQVAIKKYGPTVVLINSSTSTFVTYTNNYYRDDRCRRDSGNHAVLAVGWTVFRGETYFTIKNSWSTAWGEEGYMHMHASNNTCGLLAQPSLPQLRVADVRRVPGAAASNTP